MRHSETHKLKMKAKSVRRARWHREMSSPKRANKLLNFRQIPGRFFKGARCYYPHEQVITDRILGAR